jgi:hypothetical protein
LTIVTPTNADGSVFFADGTGGNDAFRGYLQYIHANDAMRFGTDATERARITSSGELLLNTTTDAGDYKLQVSGNAYVTGSATIGSTIIANNTPFITGSNIYASNSMAIGTNTSNFVEFYTNNTSRMVILSGGNVGIGTTSPAQKFVVSNAGSEGVEFVPGASSNSNQILSYNRATSAYADLVTRAATYNIQIGTSPALYINANNESLFNTLTDAGDYKLQVSGNAYVTGTTVLAATSGNVGVGTASPAAKVNIVHDINSSTGFQVDNLNTGSSASATIRLVANDGNGTLAMTSTSNTAAALGGRSNTLALFNGLSGSTSGGIAILARNGSDYITFHTGGNTEKIRMHANGGLKFVGQSAAPTAEAGTVYYDTDDNKLKVYNGTTWVDLH